MSASPAVGGNGAVVPVTRSSFRPDVQGLRAVAVLAVIADHLFSYPSGGFVGVDVFFVISGFLITGLLLREYELTGRISFPDFYRRRVRRILPVALVVLAVTTTTTFLVFSAVRARDAGADALWAALFGANWRFIATGTDYSEADGLVSPIQHYWSLSVEEQFYFVWPVLMVAVIAATARRSRPERPAGTGAGTGRVRTLLAVTMTLLIAASFSWAVGETAAAPTSAYFSTFSRAWELGVGALLAVAGPLLARIPGPLRTLTSWVGLVGIGASLFLISGELAFPGPWAALPVISAALIVAAGVGGTPRYAGLLTNRVSGYLGDLSYSLYLWHWPVVVLLPAFLPDRGTAFHLVALGIILTVSLLSFHLVEDPIRRSRFLEPGARRDHPGGRPSLGDRIRGADPSGNLRIGAVAVVLGAVVVAAVPVVFPPPTPIGVRADAGAAPSGVDAGDPARSLASEIEDALAATDFPAELDPALDHLDTGVWFSEVAPAGCLDITDTERSIACETGPTDTGRDVVILGDSLAIAWSPGITAALEPLGWRIHPLTRGQCPASDTSVTRTGGAEFAACDTTHRWREERIGEIRPELTIIAQAHTTADRLASGAQGPDAAAELAAGLRSTVDAITPSTGAILVLSSPPSGRSLQDCITNVGSPRDCVTTIDAQWTEVTTAEADALTGTAADYVDTVDWFCFRGRCPGIVGGTAVRVDATHLSIPYSRRLAPLIAESVQSLPLR